VKVREEKNVPLSADEGESLRLPCRKSAFPDLAEDRRTGGVLLSLFGRITPEYGQQTSTKTKLVLGVNKHHNASPI